MAPIINDPIMLGRLIGHLTTLNTKICPLVMILSTIVESFLGPFLTTREAVILLANDPIMSATSNSRLDSLNIKICPLGMILSIIVEQKI